MDSLRVHIHGATLASLLHQASVANGDCDGLLFGEVRTVVNTEFQDGDIGVVTTEQQHLYITSFVLSSHTSSFYDGAGRVQGERLKALWPAGSELLVGWLSLRQASPLQPSMREWGVTASLQALVTQQQQQQGGAAVGGPVPLVLALITSQPDHNGATLSLQYRVFQAMPATAQRPHTLQPREVSVINLARSLGQQAYALESVMAVHGAAAAGGATASSALGQAADTVVQQVGNLEEYYDGLLKQLGKLCRVVSEQSGKVGALQAENAQLMAQLRELSG